MQRVGAVASRFLGRQVTQRSFRTTSFVRNESSVKEEAISPPVEEENQPKDGEKVAMTPEEIKAERKARKELKKKKKAVKKVDIEEDEVEKKKRERKEKNNRAVYLGDGSEIDPNDENLDDNVIIKRIQEMYDADNHCDLLSTLLSRSPWRSDRSNHSLGG